MPRAASADSCVCVTSLLAWGSFMPGGVQCIMHGIVCHVCIRRTNHFVVLILIHLHSGLTIVSIAGKLQKPATISQHGPSATLHEPPPAASCGSTAVKEKWKLFATEAQAYDAQWIYASLVNFIMGYAMQGGRYLTATYIPADPVVEQGVNVLKA